jgi:hypothetical protein
MFVISGGSHSVVPQAEQYNKRGLVDEDFYYQKYLSEQRRDMDFEGEPINHHHNIIAKDFGILARLRDMKSTERTDVGFLYDYNFAGIRGLGIWGVPWVLDRRVKLLKDYSGEDDLQILLEVTYKDGVIINAIDVSDKPAEYFDEQYSNEYFQNTGGQLQIDVIGAAHIKYRCVAIFHFLPEKKSISNLTSLAFFK